MANNRIRKILYGATCHLDLVTGARLLKRVFAQVRRGTATWNNNACTQVRLLRRWLKTSHWVESGAWAWRRQGTLSPC